MTSNFNYTNYGFGLPFSSQFSNMDWMDFSCSGMNDDFLKSSIFNNPKNNFFNNSTTNIQSSISGGSGMFDFLYETTPAQTQAHIAPTSTVNHTETRTERRARKKAERQERREKKRNESTFMKRVKEVAKRINCDYKDLLAVMNAESGVNEKAVNPHGGATGLIQFMPKTAKGLGTSTHELLQMTKVEQMDYVEKFLINAKRSAGFADNEKLSGGQLYALIFLPARAKREVLTTSDESYYKWNKGTDINGDGAITKSELDQRINRFWVNESRFA